jgi:hypothetical protein
MNRPVGSRDEKRKSLGKPDTDALSDALLASVTNDE